CGLRLVAPKEAVESRAGRVPLRLSSAVAGDPQRRDLTKLEELAEVGLFLVGAPFGLRLPALVVHRGVEEAAVQTTLPVGPTMGTRIGPLQRRKQLDLVPAAMTDLQRAGSCRLPQPARIGRPSADARNARKARASESRRVREEMAARTRRAGTSTRTCGSG